MTASHTETKVGKSASDTFQDYLQTDCLRLQASDYEDLTSMTDKLKSVNLPVTNFRIIYKRTVSDYSHATKRI